LPSDVLDNFTTLATSNDLDDLLVGVIPGDLQKLLKSDVLPQVMSWGKNLLIDAIPDGVKKILSGEVLQTFTAGATPDDLSNLIVGAIPEDLKKTVAANHAAGGSNLGERIHDGFDTKGTEK